MAAEVGQRAEGKGQSGKGLGKKLGPLKVWQWALIVVGGVGGILLVRKFMANQQPGSVGSANVTGQSGAGGGLTSPQTPAGVSPGDLTNAIQSLTSSFTESQKQLESEIQASNAQQTAATQDLAGQLQSTAAQFGSALQGVSNQATAAQATASQAQAVTSYLQTVQIGRQNSKTIGQLQQEQPQGFII